MLFFGQIASVVKILIILLFSIFCSEFYTRLDNLPDSLPQDGRTLVLGKKLENPYSVENMIKAYDAMPESQKVIFENHTIDDIIFVTHHYVKFTLKSEEELLKLKMDSTIVLFCYPLDYEIISYGEGHYQHIYEDQPASYYASVEASKILPDDIEWELLEHLYIPDDYSDGKSMISTRIGVIMSEVFVELLVGKSLELTGNSESEKERRGTLWRPSGKILYEDDKLAKTIGLEGVKIRATRWFTTYIGVTDILGDYSCGGIFKRPANYSFDLERYEFCVNGDGLYTKFNALDRMENWDYSFSRSENQAEFFAATIFRAAYHYFYKNIGNLHRPSINGLESVQIKLVAINDFGDEQGYFSPAIRFWGLSNQIVIYNPHNTTDNIYAIAIHELSHAAHWGMITEMSGVANINRDFQYAEEKMIESWARGVQYFLTRMVYPDYRGGPKNIGDIYTNVVIDLIDTEADAEDNNGLSSEEGDDVSGYRMDQIEAALIGNSTWEGWKETIKNRYSNATRNNIDILFASWE
jgi:hypothetical protein